MAESIAWRILRDYELVGRIRSGSFWVVSHAKNRAHGTEVGIIEITTGRLDKEFQKSLMSEISILKNVNHPNIIRLHDIIEEPGKLYIVLEYCRGGDLAVYINSRGQVPETTAKHFMQQLAAGLKILRENNLIHAELIPQNLLLSTSDDNAILKISDFSFTRSLQPIGMDEALCGSLLWMDPETMQLDEKYAVKAVLWSVGAILFQLVTGKTPFDQKNQIQSLENISKYMERRFQPEHGDLSSECKDLCQKLLRINPVEWLPFEDFCNHPFILPAQPDTSFRIGSFSRSIDGIRSAGSSPLRNQEESFYDESKPFFLDNDSSGPEGSPTLFKRRSPIKSTIYGSCRGRDDSRDATFNALNNPDFTSTHGSANKKLRIARCTVHSVSDENINAPPILVDQRPPSSRDSLGLIDHLLTIDTIMEILVKLDVRHLFRCRFVSKKWKSLIDSEYFSHLHYRYRQQSGEHELLCFTFSDQRRLLISRSMNVTSASTFGLSSRPMISFRNSPICEIEHISHGIFLIRRAYELVEIETLILYHPVRCQKLFIMPPVDINGPSQYQFSHGLILNERTKHYLFIRIQISIEDSSKCDMWSMILGSSTWKKVDYREVKPEWEVNTEWMRLMGPVGVSFGQEIYWYCPGCLVSFDSEFEEFRFTSVPETIPFESNLLNWKNKLVLLEEISSDGLAAKFWSRDNEGNWETQFKIEWAGSYIGVWGNAVALHMDVRDMDRFEYYISANDSFKIRLCDEADEESMSELTYANPKDYEVVGDIVDVFSYPVNLIPFASKEELKVLKREYRAKRLIAEEEKGN